MRLVFVFLILFAPLFAGAQATLVQDTVNVYHARVTAVSDEEIELIPGTETSARSQNLTALILEGPQSGQTVEFKNDFIQLAVGDRFYLMHTANAFDGFEAYSVAEPDRVSVLVILILAFLLILFLFGGWQGVRGLASLIGSVILIFLILVPGILQGYSPILVATGVAGVIIVLGSYITHGFNKTTSAAVIGMLATVAITGALAFWAVYAAKLSGYTEEAAYLNFDYKGQIDLVGLLYGGIMIGLLGVLYDIAIGQAVAVEELFHAGRDITRTEVLKRGLRIGREHIGALVNTLAIAYVGASLPLLLLVQNASYGALYAINSEIFATEIIRILIGSIGLVLGVPVTTFIASRMLSAATLPSGSPSHHH